MGGKQEKSAEEKKKRKDNIEETIGSVGVSKVAVRLFRTVVTPVAGLNLFQ